MRRVVPYLLKGIGVLLFVLILSKIDRDLAIEQVSQASTLLLLAGFCLFPLIYAVKSIRWHVLTSAAGARTTFHHSTIVYMSGLFLGIVTPGKVGEAMKVPALISKGLDMKDSIAITILDRVFDIALLGVIAIWAIGLLLSPMLSLAALLVFAAILGIALLLKTPLKKLRSLLLPAISKKSWMDAFLLTLLNWIIFFAQFWLLALAFGIDIALPTFVAIITIAGIISILPIAPAGLGTRDAALLVLFGQQGIAAETTVAFSFTVFVLTLFASTIGAYFWLRYPLETHAKK